MSESQGPVDKAERLAEPADHGVNLVSVVVALAVLALLVVGIFWGLPLLFGSGVVNVTVRP